MERLKFIKPKLYKLFMSACKNKCRLAKLIAIINFAKRHFYQLQTECDGHGTQTKKVKVL